MEIFLHTCCGPCACYTTKRLNEEGLTPTLFFYNPNIHPYQEQKLRLEGVRQLVACRNVGTVVEPGYALEEFLAAVAADPKNRCRQCYRIRLARTAERAKENGFSLFGTTLLISPYQNRELICRIGHETADQYGLQFHDEDFRPGFRESQAEAKELDLYRQKYCGCIYSEKDRFYQEKSK